MTGRIKDVIIRGGENIAPHEVDDVLLRPPAVAAAVTFGYPHPTLGEEVAAAVVLHEAHGATEAQLLKHCREMAGRIQVPEEALLGVEHPHNHDGKDSPQSGCGSATG